MAEMKQCRCESTTHDHHPGNRCDKPATEEDGYCKDCHDLAAVEFDLAKSDLPDLPPGHNKPR